MSFFNSFAPKVNYNQKTLEDEMGWKLTKYGSQNLLKKLSRTGKKIGKLSVFGKVERLSHMGNEHMFIVKKIDFSPNSNRSHIFATEINVGSKNNIGKVGPRVLAFRYTPFGGEYVMDNVEMGHSNAKVFSVANVKKQFSLATWYSLRTLIQNFHKITRGQHGDLHGDNILVVQIGKNTYLRIIDYGAFRKSRELKSLGTPIKKHFGMNVYNVGKGQKFIQNKNQLKTIIKSREI